MKKWVKFKFKNPLWLYLTTCWCAVGFLAYLTIKQKDFLLFACLIAVGLVATLGFWFGKHYGIKFSDERYLLICNGGIGYYKKETVEKIVFVFTPVCENYFNVSAKVLLTTETIREFKWQDVYAKADEILEIIKNLTSDKKIVANVKTLDNFN